MSSRHAWPTPPAPGEGPEPIAILGIGCRFPGGANNPRQLWSLLRDGVDGVIEVPADRFDIDAVYEPGAARPGTLGTRYGGFVDRVDRFDPTFFGISPREAKTMDPQQRLLLEVAWEALEDAGQVPARLAGTPVAAMVGMWSGDYQDLLLDHPRGLDLYHITGSCRGPMAGRLSHILDLSGPSMTVDTACASALTAVHLACQSLRAGECSLALAGGCNLILEPQISIAFSQSGMLAPDGQCKFCDARADGFVRSEGIALVVLKTLTQALQDGDPIYAVIRATALSNDGASGGSMVSPGTRGQQQVLREAYRQAGVAARDVQYVEAHGTGTEVGDPVEVEALSAVLAADRPADAPLLIGSVKTNLGHTEGAAGLAGLIKVALSLQHGEIPPSLHLKDPSPRIDWQLPIEVPQQLAPWPATAGPRRAGVNSFGFNGSNAHGLLEQAPARDPIPDPPAEGRSELLVLSAKEPAALRDLARAYRDHLNTDPESVDSPAGLRDLCYTAARRRSHHDHRLAVVTDGRDDLLDKLEAFDRDEIRAGVTASQTAVSRPKVVFVFPGQGSQWLGMGRQLMASEEVFRRALERCDRAISACAGWSLLEELDADEERSRLEEVDVVQPVIFALQVALAALWRSWGIEPDQVIGQSLGEVAAAHVAGALTLEDAARVICRRSRLVKTTRGQGAMAVVDLSREEAGVALAKHRDKVSIAVTSSPRSTVLSGDPEALAEILAELEARQVFCRWVKVDYASHSPQMDALRDDVLAELAELEPRSAGTEMLSTVTGRRIDGAEFDAAYWAANLRQPVQFCEVVEQAVDAELTAFIEISPHAIVLPSLQAIFQQCEKPALAIGSLRRQEDERQAMLRSLGALDAAGCEVAWSVLYPAGRCLRLPTYPWQRERYWSDNPGPVDRSQRRADASLGRRWESAVQPGVLSWQAELGVDLLPELGDHRVQEHVVVPGAAMIAMILTADGEHSRTEGELGPVLFEKALFLPGTERRQVQVVRRNGDDLHGEVPHAEDPHGSFEIWSRGAEDDAPSRPWTRNAVARVEPEVPWTDRERLARPEILARCPEHLTSDEHYRRLAARGLGYGPAFQGVEELWWRPGEEALARIAGDVANQASPYRISPGLLDACFQVLAAITLSDGVDSEPLLLVSVERLILHGDPTTGRWAHARRRPSSESQDIAGDVLLFDDQDQPVLTARGVALESLAGRPAHDEAARSTVDDWFYRIEWTPAPPAKLKSTPGSWLLFADRGGVASALEEALTARGESCTLVFPGEDFRQSASGGFDIRAGHGDDYRRLLSELADSRPWRGVVHLWSLDQRSLDRPSTQSLNRGQDLGVLSALHLAQALVAAELEAPPRVWLVTGGAQNTGAEDPSPSPSQAPLWGFGRALANEHPELRCALVDLAAGPEPDEAARLLAELDAGDSEDQVALRPSGRLAARLRRWSRSSQQAEEQPLAPANERPFHLEIPRPARLDDLLLRESAPREPGPGEVEIEVSASSLNFIDVLKAMDLYPGSNPAAAVIPGGECAGRIRRLGAGVDAFGAGDEVVAVTPECRGAHACRVIVPVDFVVAKPPGWSAVQAAALPLVFMTARYALHHLARLAPGERVLIHSASGGTGLAAVHLAREIGAEIFATAGSEEKRRFLRSLGIETVMDSRSGSYADEVREHTGGEGVDVVLNTLVGDQIPRGLSILGPYGRFVDLSKRDLYSGASLDLSPFRRSLSYATVDLAGMSVWRPKLFAALLHEVFEDFDASQAAAPLPVKTFAVAEAADAFRFMAQARHVGKLVLDFSDRHDVPIAARESRTALRSDATYLITGGLGGLGLELARWMIDNGAEHLALAGRTSPSAEAQRAIEELRQSGAEIETFAADVSDARNVARLMTEIDRGMPPLRGILHAAGVLQDGALMNLAPDDFRAVAAPKIDGAWNLHRESLERPIELFVLYSSVASVLGLAGQSNYCAANAFLDALAHHRRAAGLPALSINWGAWGEVGLAARTDRDGRLARLGLDSFSPGRGLEAFGRLLPRAPAQVAVMPFEAERWIRSHPARGESPFFSELLEHKTGDDRPEHGAGDSWRESVLAAPPEQRQELLRQYLGERIAAELGLAKERVEAHRPLHRLGLDSLMSMMLRHRLEAELGVSVPVVDFLGGASLDDLTGLIEERLADSEPDPGIATTVDEDQDHAPEEELAETEIDHLLANVDTLSSEEVDSLLKRLG